LVEIKTNCILWHAPSVPKCSQLYILDYWRVHSPDCFHCKLQVEPETFDALINQIEEDPTFYSNSNCPQLPVHLQLSIFLFHAGHYSNAASPEGAAQWAGISVGAVEKCTDHVIIALLSHHDKVIHLPEADEKEDLKNYMAKQACPEWHGGYLLADGLNILFFQCPGLYGDAWFDKDGEYSIDCQVCVSMLYVRATL